MTDEQEPRTIEPTGDDPYWGRHVLLGEEHVQGRPHQVRMKLHRSAERYSDGDDYIPLRHRSGTRTYFHAKPYILIPDITVTVALSQPNGGRPPLGTQIGTVVGSHVGTPRPLEIGQAQGWYYPTDRALMLWECFLEDPFRQHTDPDKDPLHQMVWTGFEQLLLAEAPEVERVYTTHEPIYQRPLFAAFLEQRGYQPAGSGAFVREVPARR